MIARLTTEARYIGAAALAFLASAAVTVAWCGSMSGMGGMPMPGGWNMSMAWMRMPGQSWTGAAATFLGMWSVMMLAMMLPAVTPALLRYRRALGHVAPWRRRALIFTAASGYAAVWSVAGAIAWPAGVALARLEMQSSAVSRAIPLAAGLFTLAAGAVQLSGWKSRQLACCSHAPAICAGPATSVGDAWRIGLRLGVRCSYCCAPWMVLLFVSGIMELGAMAAVTAAISLERLLPRGATLARIGGLAIVATGAVMLVGLV